jgi:endonuclease YncB( thermonuclease family)
MLDPESLIVIDKPRRRTWRLFAPILFALISALYAAVYPEQLPEPVRRQLQPALDVIEEVVTENQPGLYQVTEVLDGDTIKVSLNGQTDTVRLIGIDTPETQDPRKPVQCFGQAAKAKLTELVAGGEVRLEADPADSDRDKYRRLLRYVYLPDGTFVNLELVRQGYAFAYTIFPNGHTDEFIAAEQEAREAKRGLWAGCQIDESKAVKQTNPQP